MPHHSKAHAPLVSVIMAFHTGAPYLRDAVLSVLAQRYEKLELLLCDDASSDRGPLIARELAETDPRIRILRQSPRLGPGAARNMGLSAAKGDWVTIVDADDLIHPDRIGGLIEAALEADVDIVADDLVRFGAERGTTLLSPLGLTSPWQPSALDLLAAERGTKPVPVGYLKPLIRSIFLQDARYRTDLPIGEDFDLLLRLTLAGARTLILPKPWYFYRRHGASTSFRISATDCTAIEQNIEALVEDHPEWAEKAASLLQGWRHATGKQRDFSALVQSLKHRDVAGASRALRHRPALIFQLVSAAIEGVKRRIHALSAQTGPNLRPLVLATAPQRSGTQEFLVPEATTPWHSDMAAALSRALGPTPRHLRLIGKAGLHALDYVPGWRLAELIPPPEGWSDDDRKRIARLPWPVIHTDVTETTRKTTTSAELETVSTA